MRITSKLIAAVALAAATAAAHAQAWPSRPVRFVASFPPGSPGDLVVRLIQPALSQALGQPVLVENRPGAGGNIGAQEVARATDGHTFLVGPDTMQTVNPHLYRKLGFRPAEDLVPVTYLVRFNQLLVCHPSVKARTLPELIALARTERLNYASGGPGVPGHLAMEMLLAATSTQMTHVPYRGPAPAVQDVAAGMVPCGFLASSVAGPLVRDGKLTGLAVSGTRRTGSLPAVPTAAEAGVAGFDASFFEVVAAPRGVPDAVAERLQAEIAKAMAQPEVRARLAAADLEPVASRPTDASRQMRLDFDKWGGVVDRMKLQLD